MAEMFLNRGWGVMPGGPLGRPLTRPRQDPLLQRLLERVLLSAPAPWSFPQSSAPQWQLLLLRGLCPSLMDRCLVGPSPLRLGSSSGQRGLPCLVGVPRPSRRDHGSWKLSHQEQVSRAGPHVVPLYSQGLFWGRRAEVFKTHMETGRPEAGVG